MHACMHGVDDHLCVPYDMSSFFHQFDRKIITPAEYYFSIPSQST